MRSFFCAFLVLSFTVGISRFAAAQQVDSSFVTPFERSEGRETATYNEALDFYRRLALRYDVLTLRPIGRTTGGSDQFIVLYKTSGRKENLMPGRHIVRTGKEVVILINNDIHPGEPDGVDACMMLLRDIAMGRYHVPDNIVLAVVPMYNIDGARNRSCCSRANQDGPLEYGFRGNAQNLDLNRDFIKQDASETRNLERIFDVVDPDIFIDNHVSDGADYQHVMTLLTSQHDKTGGSVGDYAYQHLAPMLVKDMATKGYDVVPYVNDFSSTPDNGWREFYDLPRFSSGFAALRHTFAFVPETHMLKPFKQRVAATEALMKSFIAVASAHAGEVLEARMHDRDALQQQNVFPIDWRVDTTRCDSVFFKGYAGGYKKSEVSGLPRLYYDHKKPYAKNVPFWNHFVPSDSVTAPVAYILPQQWQRAADILTNNGVTLDRVQHDTMIAVTTYKIESFESSPKPYEGHYLHRNTRVSSGKTKCLVRAGDFIIPLNQPLKRYLVETLEPTAPDAFFAWNFFDGVLQQKEYFSDYVFEDKAAEMLKSDPSLAKRLEEKRNSDTAFANNAAAQIDYIYRQSSFMEKTYMQYPVFRIEP